VRKTLEPSLLRRLGTTYIRPKNAFLHPTDPEAVFPQQVISTPMDFRSDAITPFACPIRSKKLEKSRQPLPVREEMMIAAPQAMEEDLSLSELKHTLGNIEKSIKRRTKMRLA
jgi:hypothetical protein